MKYDVHYIKNKFVQLNLVTTIYGRSWAKKLMQHDRQQVMRQIM